MNLEVAETVYWCSTALILIVAIVFILKKKSIVAGVICISGILWNVPMAYWVISLIPPLTHTVQAYMNENTRPAYCIPGESVKIYIAEKVQALGRHWELKDIDILKCDAVKNDSERFDCWSMINTVLYPSTGAIPLTISRTEQDYKVNPYIELIPKKDNRLERATVSLTVRARLKYAQKHYSHAFTVREELINEVIKFKIGESVLKPDLGVEDRVGWGAFAIVIIFALIVMFCLDYAWEKRKQEKGNRL